MSSPTSLITRPSPASRELAPILALAVLGIVVAVATAAAGPLAVLPIFGVLFFILVFARPEYGIALFLSTFLMSYPAALQGSGYLTINNVMGGLFGILLMYKLYSEGDAWFIRRREILLMGFITLICYLGAALNGPDPRKLSLLSSGGAVYTAENLRTFFNRAAFTIFFIAFIRKPSHVRMIYMLGLAFMLYTSLTGVQGVLAGGGLKGYRAYTGATDLVAGQAGIIRSAGNPNRLAMFAILAIAGLWYYMQTMRRPALRVVIVPLLVMLALAVFMTASRSGLLGLGTCAAAILIDEGIDLRKMLTVTLMSLMLVVVVFQFVPEKSLERITNLPGTQAGETGEGSGSLENRAYTWGLAIDLFQHNPILGVGMGNWQLFRFLNDPSHAAGSPHSSYLLTLVEGGILGLGGFLALLWCTWRNFRYAERQLPYAGYELARLSWILRSAKASFIVLVFFSLFADLWQLVILFWLVGLSIVIRRLIEQSADAEALAA